MAEAWHVVATKIREEDTAIDSLMSQCYEVFAPKIIVRHVNKDPKSEWAFEGYIFVRFDPLVQSAASINYSYGVSRLVAFGDVLATMDDGIMDLLKARFAVPFVVGNETEDCPKPGESVIINSGPFRHLQAIFLQADGKHRSTIMLKLLGTNRPIVVDNSHISR